MLTPVNILIKFLRGEKGYISILVIIMIVVGLVPCIDTLLLKQLIDEATLSSQYPGQNFISKMSIWAFLYAGWWESLNIIWRVYDYCYMKSMPKIKASIIEHFFNHTQYHSNKFFQDNLAGYLTNRIMEAARAAEMAFSMINERIIRRMVSITGALITMYYINPIFALIFIIWLSFFISLSILLSGKIDEYSRIFSKNKAKVSGKIVDAISNIGAIKTFARYKFESVYLKKYLDKVVTSDKVMQWFMFKLRYILGLSTSIMIFAIIHYLVKLKSHNVITIGDFVAIIGLCTALSDDIWDLVQEIGDTFEELGALSQSLSLLRPHDIIDKENAERLIVRKGEIRYENVLFRYNKDANLFDNLSVAIPPKQKVGLVGFSGSGKTTFVSLINRLHDITEGKILIDSTDISEVTQDSLHKNISFIPQEPILFHRTIRENIIYGKQEALEDEMIEATKRACIHDIIMEMPNKYDTLCGERGNTLSGGQRQRIVIARAILKNAPILILDEATSALDTITEKAIQESLEYLMKDKTVMIIAHRLSTLLDMDRILVFHEGNIVEDGSHEQLIKRRGNYYDLWSSQVKGFVL